jgi:hypothetical protein
MLSLILATISYILAAILIVAAAALMIGSDRCHSTFAETRLKQNNDEWVMRTMGMAAGGWVVIKEEEVEMERDEARRIGWD